MDFSEVIKIGRIKKGYSQQDLATLTGLSLQTIKNYELGKRKPRRRKVYMLLEEILDVSHLERN